MENQEFENTNASDIWMKSILDSLQRLEDYELVARQGCENLIEHLGLQLNLKNEFLVAEAQLKNLDFMITDMDILFCKIKPRTSKKFNEDFGKDLKKIIKIINSPSIPFIKRGKKTRSIRMSTLQEPFYKLLDWVLKLKSKIIQELSPFLFVEKQEKTGSSNFKR